MLDIQTAPAAPPVAIHREDYRAPDWLVPEVALEFDLDAVKTQVRATLHVTRMVTTTVHLYWMVTA